MNGTSSAHVVSARLPGTQSVVYFDSAGLWTADLHSAQIARSVAGRKAMLRVASALAKGEAFEAPALVPIDFPAPLSLTREVRQ